MLTRRNTLLGAAAMGTVAHITQSCSSGSTHEEVARSLRRPIIVNNRDRSALLRELVRYATLAPSSHNTQCWKFRMHERSIAIEPDLLRRCPVVDPDDHHLFVSLGCSTENLAHAALANGLQAVARYDPTGSGTVAVSLEATQAQSSPLFRAISERQCSRSDYDGRPLSTEEFRLLEQAGTSSDVRLVLLTERTAMEKVLEYVVAANTAQMNAPTFVDELKTWIRFSADEAARTGDGLFAGASGNPAMPRWLGSRMMGMFFTTKSENERYARQIRNSAGIAVFISGASDRAHWVEAGRCYKRFALQATALGIRNAFLNQPVEVGPIRPQFASALGLGNQRPDLVVRFGRGPTMPLSMRRPVQAVLV
jgi:hypothetical protein